MGWIIQELVFLEKMEKEKSKLTRKKSVFNFNHIDTKNKEKILKILNTLLNTLFYVESVGSGCPISRARGSCLKERKEELEKLFKFYHKLWYCYKKVHSREKKILFGLNLISVTLVTTGTIVGGVTMNPVILGVISGAGVILKTTMEMKNLQKKIENSKVAFTSYEKLPSRRNV